MFVETETRGLPLGGLAVIVTSEGAKLFNPSPDATLVAGETLIVLGRPAALDRLRLLARG